jgi:hypothetical protein
MHMTRLLPLSLTAALALAAGAAFAQPAAKPAEGAAKPAEGAAKPAAAKPAEGGAVVGPPAVAWKDMTKEQKGKFMKAVVVPKMKPAFQAFDADQFKKFDCRTCHGKDPKAKEFKMPNPDIYVLPGTPAGFGELMQKKPKWMKFMGEQVKPQMAALLGLPNFDPKKPEPGAFGCMACHTTKKEEGAAAPAKEAPAKEAAPKAVK